VCKGCSVLSIPLFLLFRHPCLIQSSRQAPLLRYMTNLGLCELYLLTKPRSSVHHRFVVNGVLNNARPIYPWPTAGCPHSLPVPLNDSFVPKHITLPQPHIKIGYQMNTKVGLLSHAHHTRSLECSTHSGWPQSNFLKSMILCSL
jgi:hypothetical protein